MKDTLSVLNLAVLLASLSIIFLAHDVSREAIHDQVGSLQLKQERSINSLKKVLDDVHLKLDRKIAEGSRIARATTRHELEIAEIQRALVYIDSLHNSITQLLEANEAISESNSILLEKLENLDINRILTLGENPNE